MELKRISLGFDLRINPDLQTENRTQLNQYLVPGLYSPISADANVWITAAKMEKLTEHVDTNPLHLKTRVDLLLDACTQQAVSSSELWPVCFTASEPAFVVLRERFGSQCFDDLPGEDELLSRGWQRFGFDTVDLDGLISGLKGCGYLEPTWSQLRSCFGSALNEFGLFEDWSSASEFAEVRGLQIRSHAPFVVSGVLVKNHQ